jgi:NAD(P)-dependent dehydrogenase (short-subunit alcohol dehydrogenase family)
MDSFRPDLLAGSNAFVAGGTSGINLGIAEQLIAHGANVTVLSRNPERVDTAVAHLRAASSGGEAAGHAADVRDFEAVNEALQACHERFGLLDIVVSGAAGNFLCPAEQLSSNAFRAVVDIDLLGTFHVLRAAFDRCRKPGAAFVNISAPQAAVPFWGQAHVCAAKAGVDMLTKALAYEWGVHGIRVNAVVPGPIENTEGVERLLVTEELREAGLRAVPLRRFGTTRDIADMVLFLASEAGAYVNGSILYCDGGQTISGGGMFHPDNFA